MAAMMSFCTQKDSQKGGEDQLDVSRKSIVCTELSTPAESEYGSTPGSVPDEESSEESLHKIGTAHITKAMSCYDHRNYLEMLRYSELALAQLCAMKKRPLEAISEAMAIQCQALKFLGRHAEALQSAKTMYSQWEIERGPAHLFTIDAAFYLVESSLFNRQFQDAAFFANTLWDMIHRIDVVDNIPTDKRQKYVANAAQMLAQATYQLAENGGHLSLEEKQHAEELSIARARQSVEINKQEYGATSEHVALSMGTLSDVLDYFSDGRNDEVLCLNNQALAIHMRMYGKMSMNVGTCEYNLGSCYDRRANNAQNVNDWDQCYAHLELALTHYREAVEIFQTINFVDNAVAAKRNMAVVEDQLLRIAATRAVSLSMSGKSKTVSGKEVKDWGVRWRRRGGNEEERGR